MKQQRANASEENSQLRRTVRDLVAFSTLPAVWAGLGPEQIARSLANVLLNTLSLDLIYLRLADSDRGGEVEVVCSENRSATLPIDVVRRTFASVLTVDQIESSVTIPNPLGGGLLHVTVTRFSSNNDQGVIVSASSNPEFPTERDRALLGVGANQTAMILQRRRAEQQVQQQREWLRVTLASIGDAVIATDTKGRVTYLNAVAEELTGWRPNEAEGNPLETIFPIVNEKTRLPVENPVERVLREGIVVGLGNHTVLLARDGTERPIDDSASPILDALGNLLGVVLIFRDVTEQRRLERYRNARLAVTSALSDAESVEAAAAGVIRAIGENVLWDAGFIWTVSDKGNALCCRQSWHRPGVPVHDFETASYSRTFDKGQGLPGRVWATGEPAWILDIDRDDNFPRLAAARGYGLHSAFAIPVVVRGQVLGVIEFFTKNIHEPDADLLEMMGTFAGSLGQFIERKSAENELRQSEQELADFFENATVGLHWVGADGTILKANRAELDMLGYRREEYVGRRIADFHADDDVISDILKRLRNGEKLTDYPARLECKDGSIKEVLIDSSVMWRDGQFVHTRCFTRDITEQKRAEAMVREQEQRTRTILESITDAFCGLDSDWRFTYVNRHAEVLLGRDRDDLIGKDHWEEYPATVGTDLERCYRRAVSENVTIALEHFYPPHDRWYEVHAYPSPQGLSVFFHDVTQRKQAEIALRQSELRFRQLADAMPQIVWTAGPDGEIDYLNRRWTEFTGEPQAVSNDAWAPLLHPEEAASAYERWAASVDTGAPFEMELRLLDRRQESYRWHLLRTVPIPNGDGTVARWFGTATDIHEQKRAEQSSRFLAQASAELAVVVDYESTLQKVASLAVPYFADWSTVDVAGDDGNLRRLGIAHHNPEKIALVRELMRDYPPDPQSGVGIYAVLRSGKPELVGDITDEMLVREAKDERHLRLIRSLNLKSYMCVPLIISGKTLGLLTFATAESRRKYVEADLVLAMDLAHRAAVAIENTQLYQALRETDRRKDEFLATLAHELRNPLAPVQSAVQILKMPRLDSQTAERSRAMIERQVQHLVRLVDDLLDMSRVMRGKVELRREYVELAMIVARAVETVQPLLETQGHQLHVSVSSESLLLDADPVRLSQVIGNLLTNAAKYTEPGGQIWLKGVREGGMAVLRVEDNGIGIAAHMLPRIFELFVQVDHAATKAQGGLGIGLTLVKNLVEMHNGIVEAHSEGLGHGAEFVVRLPLVERTVERDDDADSAPHAYQAPLLSGKRLVVVDDNQDAADTLAMLLNMQGHEVHVAYSGVAALEKIKTYTPDVVLLDIGMPGMDGYEVARRIRQTPGLATVVLVALTGWGQQEDRRRTAEAGFNHHLVKPPAPDVLEKLLAE
jgi:PAS domain S-box-containing protein